MGTPKKQLLKISDLDYQHADEIRSDLLELLGQIKEQTAPARFTLDLSGVAGIDLSGVQILLGFRKSLAEMNKDMQAAQVQVDWVWGDLQARLHRLCEFCGLDPSLIETGIPTQGA